MKGLFLNIDFDKAKLFAENLNIPYETAQFPSAITNGFVVYDEREWANPPVYSSKDYKQFIAVYGWFIYKQKKNVIVEFLDDFVQFGKEILHHLQGGVFLIYLKIDGQEFLINDFLSLSNHYIDLRTDVFIIAPSPYFFQDKRVIPELKEFLDQQEHLFDNYTFYKGIERLNPGSFYFNPSSFQRYYFYGQNSRPFSAGNLIHDLNALVNFWPYEQRILALSGGLDSRLILASSKYKYGYSYGPSNSRDRLIASEFKNDFDSFHAFSLMDISLKRNVYLTVCDMFSGSRNDPFYGLFEAFRYLFRYFPKAHFDYDGFLFDVFLRGTYLSFTSFKGLLFRVFPFLFYRRKSGNELVLRILRKRYSDLSNYHFKLLKQSFLERTAHLDLDPFAKLTYYEVFYGRGTRYIIGGGIVMKSQFFTVIPPIAYKPILDNLASINLLESLKHYYLKPIWKQVDKKYQSVPTESCYLPVSNPYLSRWMIVISKFFQKKIFRRKGFGDELKIIEEYVKKSV